MSGESNHPFNLPTPPTTRRRARPTSVNPVVTAPIKPAQLQHWSFLPVPVEKRDRELGRGKTRPFPISRGRWTSTATTGLLQGTLSHSTMVFLNGSVYTGLIEPELLPWNCGWTVPKPYSQITGVRAAMVLVKHTMGFRGGARTSKTKRCNITGVNSRSRPNPSRKYTIAHIYRRVLRALVRR